MLTENMSLINHVATNTDMLRFGNTFSFSLIDYSIATYCSIRCVNLSMHISLVFSVCYLSTRVNRYSIARVDRIDRA